MTTAVDPDLDRITPQAMLKYFMSDDNRRS
jgi:hypothetical protein